MSSEAFHEESKWELCVKAFSGDSCNWEDEDVLRVVYGMRQFLAIVFGFVWGVFRITGAAGVLGFVTADKYADDDVLYLFAGVDGVRFKRQVVPGDQLMLEAKIDSVKRTIWRFKCRATVDGELACEATILCALKSV